MSHKTILAVDDAESNIDILVDALGNEYEIVVALDGESALEIVAEDKPDLILLDIMMPGIDGFEVLERLKASPARKRPICTRGRRQRTILMRLRSSLTLCLRPK